jgi:hypothetical protein
MMFDPKCYELAEYFLADNGAATDGKAAIFKLSETVS